MSLEKGHKIGEIWLLFRTKKRYFWLQEQKKEN